MAAYTATSWTVTYFLPSDYEIGSRKKRVHAKLVLPTGGTIPLAGIPLPVAGKFGMKKKVDYYILHTEHDLSFSSAPQNCMRWQINTSGNTIQARKYSTATLAAAPSGGRALRAQLATIANATAHTLYVTAVGY